MGRSVISGILSAIGGLMLGACFNEQELADAGHVAYKRCYEDTDECDCVLYTPASGDKPGRYGYCSPRCGAELECPAHQERPNTPVSCEAIQGIAAPKCYIQCTPESNDCPDGWTCNDADGVCHYLDTADTAEVDAP